MPINPTSMRFTDAELELIRVHALRLEERTGRRHTPTDVIRFLLRQSRPSATATGTHEPALRHAYAEVFGADS